MIRLVSFALISVAYALALSSKFSLTGDHICRKEENYTETVNSTSSEPIQVRKNFWCIEKIRCSELKADVKEIVESKNLTKTRTIEFCCPNYEEVEENGKLFCRSSCKCVNGNCSTSGKCDCGIGFTGEFCEQACPPNKFGDMCMKYCKCGDHKCDAITGECLKGKVTSTVKPEKSSKPEPSVINQNHTVVMIMPDINPYRVHSPREIEGESEELQNVDYQDGNEFIYLDTNELPDIETTPTYLDHHQLNQHNESMAMVTVGCVVLGMFVFLIVMVILRRLTRRRRVDHEDDFQETMKQIKLDPAKIVYPPMPIAPLRPSLRKSKSVTFDDSFDEVDEKNPKDLHNPSDTYDVPRKQSSMTDLTNRAPPMIPLEMSSKCFNTFPKRISTPNKSLEHIYAEIQSKKA